MRLRLAYFASPKFNNKGYGVVELVLFALSGVALILSVMLIHQAWLIHKSYKKYNPNCISQKDEGCITSLDSGVSKIQDKPVIPF